jgi:replicative DNA helicase
MSKEKLVERLMSIGSKHWWNNQLQGVSGLDLQAGAVDEDKDGPVLTQAYNDLLQAPIYISESAETIPQIKSISRQHVAKHGVGLIIIDYLQLIEADKKWNKNREQEVSEMSRGIKNLARELKVPVVLLSQLKRDQDQRKESRPKLSDLRESGAIEQDADVVLFLHNPEYQTTKTERQPCPRCTENPLDPVLTVFKGRCTECGNLWTIEIDLIIAKVRDGSTGEIKLVHIPAMYWFGDGGEGGWL